MDSPKLKSIPDSKKHKRSLSPNNVFINGQMIDKECSDSVVLPKRMLLDNILEETDSFPSSDQTVKDSGPLEDAVKMADENVQKFIQEMSESMDSEIDDDDFAMVCKSSHDEIRSLSKFLAAMDKNSKGKIVNTLISVYKNEIASGIKNEIKKQKSYNLGSKIGKFKEVCKDLINECRNKSVASQYDRIDYIAPNLLLSSGAPSSSLAGQGDQESGRLNSVFKDLEAKFAKVKCMTGTQDNKKLDSDEDNKTSLNIKTNFMVNYQTQHPFITPCENIPSENASLSLEKQINKRLGCQPASQDLGNPLEPYVIDTSASFANFIQVLPPPNVKKDYANLPIDVDQSNELALNWIRRREKCLPVAQPEVHYKNYSELCQIDKNIPPIKRGSFATYQKAKEISKDPFPPIETLISEGNQTSYTLLKKFARKYRGKKKQSSFEYVKPFKYLHTSAYGSQSDLAINWPLECQLKPKKSKSDTDLRKQGALLKESNMKSFPMERKSSWELLRAKEIRRNKKLISYLDQDLRSGDSENQFSQILFQSPHENMENDLSAEEIPAVQQKSIDYFNPNYLLTSLKIDRTHSDILQSPLKYLNFEASEISVTEEEYTDWLRKQNWSKYSNLFHEMQSMDQLKSISETAAAQTPSDPRGELGYYLDRGDYVGSSSKSSGTSSILTEFGEMFLYEHVVISRAINLFLSFNAKRTKKLTLKDRCVQVLFFAVFYGMWVYFSTYVFVDPPAKKKTMWK